MFCGYRGSHFYSSTGLSTHGFPLATKEIKTENSKVDRDDEELYPFCVGWNVNWYSCY
jgi:hypothetical protein